MNRIQKWLDSRILEKETSVREEKFQFEAKLEEAKLEMHAKVQSQAEGLKSAESAVSKSGASECTPVKLPKIDIVKFDRAYMDWPRFWGQFTETVDRSNIPAINKFTYLCGFLGPKVRRRVESLPFTPEGYNREKAILQDQYGKNSEIVKAYIKEIMDFPQIPGVHAKKIADFSEKLSYSVQALETLGKLKDVQGNVSMTLDKLSGIRGDLVRNDPEWESWDFVKLAEAIRQWIRRNPIHERETETQSGKFSTGRLGKAFHAKAAKMCVYCEGEHRTGDCTVVLDVNKRREILAKKKLCFNCAAGQHRANSCPSKSTCRKCNKRHHTTICDTSDKGEETKGERKLLTASGSRAEGIFPVVVVKVNGITCRALIDSGSGSSYVSGKLASMLKTKPIETKISRIDMLFLSKTTKLEIYEADVEEWMVTM